MQNLFSLQKLIVCLGMLSLCAHVNAQDNFIMCEDYQDGKICANFPWISGPEWYDVLDGYSFQSKYVIGWRHTDLNEIEKAYYLVYCDPDVNENPIILSVSDTLYYACTYSVETAYYFTCDVAKGVYRMPVLYNPEPIMYDGEPFDFTWGYE